MALVSPLSLWLAAPRKPNPAPTPFESTTRFANDDVRIPP